MTRRKPATVEVHPSREESPDAVIRAAADVLENDAVTAAAQRFMDAYERDAAESARFMDAMLAEHNAAVEVFGAQLDAMLKGDE